MRPLNHIEQAFTYTNEVNPLCVVIVLRLREGPTAEQFRKALGELQRRHILLQCGIEERRGALVFSKMAPPQPISLREGAREGSTSWEEVVEAELNTRFDASGPLIRTVHLVDDSAESELVIVLHHAIMDGISARLLLHELLHLATDEPLAPPLPETDQIAAHLFPPDYRGARLAFKVVPFLASQMWKDLMFARRGVNTPAASAPHNRVLHLCIPADVSRRINLRIGREGLSLNSVINAALLLAVRSKLHPGAGRREGSSLTDPGAMEGDDGQTAMRAISFTDLRPSLVPEPQESVLGCMISMLRVTVPVESNGDLIEVARRLRREIFTAGKSGEPFLMAVLAKHMTRLALRIRRGRMANSAVSFLGKLDLEPQYGATELADVHAFITNNVVGPELSGFGKVLFGRIELDLTYLSSEISETTAGELLSEIEVSLHELAV